MDCDCVASLIEGGAIVPCPGPQKQYSHVVARSDGMMRLVEAYLPSRDRASTQSQMWNMGKDGRVFLLDPTYTACGGDTFGRVDALQLELMFIEPENVIHPIARCVIAYDHLHLFEVLYQAGLDLADDNYAFISDLVYRRSFKTLKRCLELLRDVPRDVLNAAAFTSERPYDALTMLHWEELEVFDILLDEALPGRYSLDYLLEVACYRGKDAFVFSLLRHGANIRANGFAFLKSAVHYGHCSTVQLLLDTFPELVTEFGPECMSEALRIQFPKMIRILLGYGIVRPKCSCNVM